MIGYYLTHPQVAIDPGVPVPRWSLSERGRARVEAMLGRRWLGTIGRVVSSDEQKAIETAALIAASIGLTAEIGDSMGENDRSSTGFLESLAFEAAADRFFAEPETSWNGWERAVDASDRITGAVEGVLATHPTKTPILFVGHGAVGTLLKCRFAGRSISRAEDQPGGGGNIFAFRLAERALLCDWTPMETFEGADDAA